MRALTWSLTVLLFVVFAGTGYFSLWRMEIEREKRREARREALDRRERMFLRAGRLPGFFGLSLHGAPERSIEGEVLGPGGEPLEGVLIFDGELPDDPNRESKHFRTRTDAKGWFSYSMERVRSPLLYAYHPDYAPKWYYIMGDGPMTCQLEQGATLEGQVWLGDEPIQGAEVFCRVGPCESQPVTTNADGAFRLTALPETAGDPAWVSAEHKLEGSRWVTTLRERVQSELKPGEISRVEIRYTELSASLEGRITVGNEPGRADIRFANGVPRTGAIYSAFIEVRWGDNLLRNAECFADQEGRYRFPKLPAGPVQVIIRTQDGREQFRVKAGRFKLAAGSVRHFDYDFPEGGVLHGEVSSPYEDGETRVYVYAPPVYGPGEWYPGGSFVTEPTGSVLIATGEVIGGRYWIEHIPPGEYVVIAKAAPISHSARDDLRVFWEVQEVKVENGKAKELRLALRKTSGTQEPDLNATGMRDAHVTEPDSITLNAG